MMKKSKNLALLSLFTVVFLVATNGYQEAEAALFSSECAELNHVVFEQMNSSQQSFAQKCAAIEAAQAWEQSYGDLNTEMLMAGVVYE